MPYYTKTGRRPSPASLADTCGTPWTCGPTHESEYDPQADWQAEYEALTHEQENHTACGL